MNRTAITIAILAAAGIATGASAHDMAKHHAGKRDTATHAPSTITGEIVDAGCYLDHAAKGASHAECAAQCIQGGMPMCLLTDQGALYLLTMNHENADPYNKLKGMAGKTVTVTGVVMTRGAMKGIDVRAIRLMDTKSPSQPARAS